LGHQRDRIIKRLKILIKSGQFQTQKLGGSARKCRARAHRLHCLTSGGGARRGLFWGLHGIRATRTHNALPQPNQCRDWRRNLLLCVSPSLHARDTHITPCPAHAPRTVSSCTAPSPHAQGH
jgi:hypothetical protein